MKHITICADDYGQNPTISQAIIELLKKKRISATSCMVNSLFWPAESVKLKPFLGLADIGLHFNLTEGKPLSAKFAAVCPEFMPLSQLLKDAFLKRLSAELIEAELHAQLDQFIEKIGQLPSFIDGHQHVHHFPTIRNALLNVYHQRFSDQNVYVRSVHDAVLFKKIFQKGFFKKLIIELSGAYALKKLLLKENIPHNVSFAGIYDFVNAQEYSHYFADFLQQSKTHGIIMCHPGLANCDDADSIAEARVHEYQFFSGQDFTELCQQGQILITTLQR